MTQPIPDFNQQLEMHSRDILAHCYRMMGSLQEAEDIAQETYLKAWKNSQQFDQRSSLKTWLYKIATNTCIDALRQQKRRQLILDEVTSLSNMSPSSFIPTDDITWLDPFPDSLLPDAPENPEAVLSQRESISLAFMIALQNLPARQRAILLLRDVLNWRSKEVAEFLDMTDLAVSSALNRARKKIEMIRSEHIHQPDNANLDNLLKRYVAAWENADIEGLIALIKEDAIMIMPPLSLLFHGRNNIRDFILAGPLSDSALGGKWSLKTAQFNHQPAFAMSIIPNGQNDNQAFCINVLTIENNKIARLDFFLVSSDLIPLTNTIDWFNYF